MHDVDVSSSHEMYDGSMRRQQNTLLLCLGEQGKIFSHTLYDVAGGGAGTISLIFDDGLEALPS